MSNAAKVTIHGQTLNDLIAEVGDIGAVTFRLFTDRLAEREVILIDVISDITAMTKRTFIVVDDKVSEL